MNDNTKDHIFLLLCKENLPSLMPTLKSSGKNLERRIKGSETFDEICSVIISDFYLFFKSRDINNITLEIAYYLFQSFSISDPHNFFLHDEDSLQILLFKTWHSLSSLFDRTYGNANLSKREYVIPIDVFIYKNFSRVMALEFRNFRKKRLNHEEDPLSESLNNSSSYLDFMYDLSVDYEMNEELIFLSIGDLKNVCKVR